MSQLNPFVAAILPAAQIHRQQSADRVQQIRRGQELSKNAASRTGDGFDHSVESADAVSPVGDPPARQQQQKKRDKNHRKGDATDGEKPTIDLTA